MLALARRLPTAESLRRRAPAIAGFFFGAALQLVLAGIVAAAHSGGLSDTSVARPSVYILY